MIATIIFWAVIIVFAICAFRETNTRASYNVAGYTKVSGEWKQTMYPDHYTYPFVYLVYSGAWVGLTLGVFLAVGFILYLTGIDDRLGICTGIQVLFGLK